MCSLRLLSEPERLNLETSLKRSKNLGEWKRLFVILSYDEGQSVQELARLTRLSQWTIEEYLKEYNSRNKTKNDPKGGSSSKLTEGEAKELEQHLSKTTYLKVKSIVAYVHKTFGKQYSRTGMTEWLVKHGFSFKKPEKVPGKLDPTQQAKFVEEYENLKAGLKPGDSLFFLDAV